MKILISSIIDLLRSLPNRPHHIISMLLSRDHEIDVISPYDHWKASQLKEDVTNDFLDLTSRLRYYFVTMKKISPILQEILFPTFSSYADLKDRIQDYNIHLNYNSLFLGFANTRMALKHSIPTVYDISDHLEGMILDSPQIPTYPIKKIGSFIGKKIINKNVKLSSKVTVTCKNLVNHYKIPNRQNLIISNGVDTKKFCYNPREEKKLRERFLTNDDELLLCYIGALREWVDFVPVFQAIHRLIRKGFRIKIIICGQEGFFEENNSLARNILPEEVFIFTGSIPYDEVPNYISASDICIIPFKKNRVTDFAVPLKLFEYMACKKPIISTPLSTITEIAQDRILYADTVKGYISAILKIVKNDLKPRIDVEENRRWVKQNYDWEKISKNMCKLLEDLAR